MDHILKISDLTVNNDLDKKKLAGIVIGCTILVMSIIIIGLTIWIKKKKLMRPGKVRYNIILEYLIKTMPFKYR